MSTKSFFSSKRVSNRDKLQPAPRPYVPAKGMPEVIEWNENIKRLPLATIDDFNAEVECVPRYIEKFDRDRDEYFYRMPDGRRLRIFGPAEEKGHCYIVGVYGEGDCGELVVDDGYVWQEVRTAFRAKRKPVEDTE